MAEWLPFLLGTVAGAVLGLTGAGGSLLAIPLLVYGLHWPFARAVPVALLAVSAAALLGTVQAWPSGLVRWRAALLLALLGALTVRGGMWLADWLPVSALTLAFAITTTAVAWRMWSQARTTPDDARVVRADVDSRATAADSDPACGVDPQTGRLRWTRRCFVTIAMSGALTGILSGALGVGGGFVIVPALRLRTGLTIQSAVATSLMAIALISAAGVVSAVLAGRLPTVAQAAPFVLGALAGMAGGRALAPRIAGAGLQRFFALSMFMIAVAMTYDALSK